MALPPGPKFMRVDSSNSYATGT